MMESVRGQIEAINVYVGSSTFGRIFHLDGSGHVSPPTECNFKLWLIAMQDCEIKNTRLTTELRAGLTTFFTMSYIIAANVGKLYR
jgi:AGZA family xanthine/uracil permease-like MFS transporter